MYEKRKVGRNMSKKSKPSKQKKSLSVNISKVDELQEPFKDSKIKQSITFIKE
jgi:hypothetical protein